MCKHTVWYRRQNKVISTVVLVLGISGGYSREGLPWSCSISAASAETSAVTIPAFSMLQDTALQRI